MLLALKEFPNTCIKPRIVMYFENVEQPNVLDFLTKQEKTVKDGAKAWTHDTPQYLFIHLD